MKRIQPESSSEHHQPSIGIIANIITREHRISVVEKLGEPNKDGFFNPFKFEFETTAKNMIFGEIILLDILSEETASPQVFKLGQKYLQAAVAYFYSRGIKIVAFTSATKRLAGKNGESVKSLYPEMTFTIGDNGTLLSCLRLIDYCLENIERKEEIVIMGAGFLGEAVISHLLDKGYTNITVFSEQRLQLPDTIKITSSLKDVGRNVKLFISCTHKYRDRFEPSEFNEIFADSAVIVDVAVPPGIGDRLYRVLKPNVERYDAGDYFLPGLRYDFDPVLLQFPAVGFWYGCFTESIFLGLARENNENLFELNFFQVNQENMELIDSYLKGDSVHIPFINFLDTSKRIEFIPY